MGLRVFAATAACKIARRLLRLTGHGATNLPGKVALRLCPDLLGTLSKGVTTVIVTGTNGKTTTSRMIEQTVKDSGLSYFANKSGANLLYGITNEFAANATLGGKAKKKLAIIECDEAAFKTVSKYVDAKYVLVTNVFRDQLDRYGEITHTLDNIRIGIENSPNAKVCLNADCSMTASLKEVIPNDITLYGVNVPIYKERVKEASDAPYCIHCKHEYTYDYITYGHLGKYHCDNCGYKRPDPGVYVNKVFVSDETHSEVEITAAEGTGKAVINLPGGYNIYNAISAVAITQVMGIDNKTAISAMSNFEVGFGRMEEFTLDGVSARMILIKNPAGCNQVLNFLSNLSNEAEFVICLNDRYADGTDVSWIWDVDFETLKRAEDKLSGIIVSGTRAYDMATRLKYAGISREKLKVIEDYDELLDEITAQDKPVYIMPTYTAMMDLRAKVSKRYGYKDFWE